MTQLYIARYKRQSIREIKCNIIQLMLFTICPYKEISIQSVVHQAMICLLNKDHVFIV